MDEYVAKIPSKNIIVWTETPWASNNYEEKILQRLELNVNKFIVRVLNVNYKVIADKCQRVLFLPTPISASYKTVQRYIWFCNAKHQIEINLFFCNTVYMYKDIWNTSQVSFVTHVQYILDLRWNAIGILGGDSLLELIQVCFIWCPSPSLPSILCSEIKQG